MVDIPNDTSTTVSVGIGESYTGTLEIEGDKDWVKVTLQAGVTYAFDLEGAPTGAGTLIDPWITGLYDSNGVSLGKSDDDGGVGRNSELIFTPSVSGTYYVELGNWINPDGTESPTGTYKFSFHEYVAPDPTPTAPAVVENVDASGITGIDALLGLTRYQNVTGEETTHVTFSIPQSGSAFSTATDDYGPTDGDGEPWTGLGYLTSSEEAIFRDALSQASSFAGLTFDEVADNATTAGTVRIAWTGVADENAAAWAYLPSGSVLAGDIWLLSQNLDSGGYGSYFNLTVIHELGHALGLKHSFEADPTGVTMPAQYDGLEYTVMSYSTSVEGDYSGASFYPTTFMYWDIKALQYLYGAIDKAVGNTTYTFAAGTKYYETIWDTGGTDTYDASAQTADLSLDLTPGSWSNVGTRITLFGNSQNLVKTATVYTPPEITIENAIGGSGSDVITGNSAANSLVGNAGNDTIDGAGGADTLNGGSGDDRLTGGAGADLIVFGGGSGSDVVTDFVAGTDTIDLATAGLTYGSLTITDSGSGVRISDGAGDTVTLTGVTAAELSRGDFGASGSATAGSDAIYATAGKDTIKSLAGDDTIDARAGDDFVSSSDGKDLVMAGAGNDQVYAGAGNDTLRGDDGNDILGGGDGNDLVIGGSSNATVFEFTTSGQDGADTLYGGAGDDTLVGGSWSDDGDGIVERSEVGNATGDGNNVVWSGAGSDHVFGAGGRDTLGGGDGNDDLNGMNGADILYGGPGAAAQSNDTLTGGNGNDSLYGGDGNDLLSGGADKDLMFGGSGDDTLDGGVGSDTLWGGDGNDSMLGDAGADTLNGGAGNDTLDGGDDADRIVGGQGNDLLTGGAGADSFVFASGHGDDTVSDFSVSEDILVLSSTATNFTTLASVQAAASEVTVNGEAGLMIDTGGGDTIFLVGLQIGDLSGMDITY